MKAEFWINTPSVTETRKIYCEECRNFQFDVPCSLSIENFGMDATTVLTAITKALEGIAWIKGMKKEVRITNREAEKPCSKITIEEIGK